jgi:hypothetical protein
MNKNFNQKNMTKQIPKLFLLIAAILFISNVYSQTCPTGLVSYWKMDELSGSALADFKSNHNASCSSAPGRDYSGKVIYAQVFDTLKYASVPNNTDYNFGVGSSFTVVYWIKFTETSYFGQDHAIISKGDWNGGNPSAAYFSSGINGSGNVNFLLSDGNVKRDLESPLSYNDGNWHQVACVRDGSANTNYLYVDGTVVAQVVYTYTGGFTNSNNLFFGCLMNFSSPGFYYKGSVDEIAIYNKALSSSDINTQRTAANTNGIGICDGLNPNIISIPGTKASVNGAYTYTLRTAGKQAGLIYTVLTKPASMTLTSGVISWTPASKTEDGLVVIKADNGVAPADTQTFRIYISDQITCPSGLLCLFKLNETAGPTYADHYGSHNATASTSPTATTGKVNGGQIFGSSTKIDIPDNGTQEFNWTNAGSFSLEAWVRTSTAADMVVIGRFRTDPVDTIAMWRLGTTSAGKASFELRDNGGHYNFVEGTTTISDNGWHHIVAVRNGSNNTSKIYVDGVEENSSSYYYGNSFKDDNPLVVTLGYLKRATIYQNEYHYVGSMDEVAIFNRALSGTDITSYYNSGSPTGHCAEGNSAPAFTSTALTTATEDSPYTYNITVDDIDAGDVLTLSAPTLPTPLWLTLNWTAGQKTATLTGTPLNANVGANNVQLRVTDTHSTINQTFTISVANVNDAPVITSAAPAATVNEGASYSYTLTVTDEDAADVITIDDATLPTWLTFAYTPGAKTATISGIPDDANVGANPIDLTINDGHTTIHQAYTLTVNGVNDLPVITGQSAININEDQSITLVKTNLTIVDPDNSASDLTLIVQSGTNYTFSGNIVTPALNYNGQINVNVVVNDLAGASNVYPVVITVAPINDSPVVTSSAVTTAKVGDLYVYMFAATDADNVSLTYSAVAKPDWLGFNATNGILNGIPAIADIGPHLVILRASDGTLSVDQAFTVTVGTTGISEAKDNEFAIYPVPANDELNIKFSNLTEETVVNIISTSGSIIESINVPANTNMITIPVQELEAGLYICHIKNNTFNSTSRFFIVR